MRERCKSMLGLEKICRALLVSSFQQMWVDVGETKGNRGASMSTSREGSSRGGGPRSTNTPPRLSNPTKHDDSPDAVTSPLGMSATAVCRHGTKEREGM